MVRVDIGPNRNSSEGRIHRFAVYCGSAPGSLLDYADAVRSFGALMASNGIRLIYGGGRVGLMGILADSVLQAGGHATGVIPRALVDAEIAHRGLSELQIVDSMHERKRFMFQWADAFVLLPGGPGSWEEFLEIFTWLQLGIHSKPCAVLNVASYYDALLALSSRAVSEGFMGRAHQQSVIVEQLPERLLSRLLSPRGELPPSKWRIRNPMELSGASPRPRVGVGVLLADSQNRILLTKRLRPPEAGLWSIVGGKLDFLETLENCAVREAWEEVGLRIEVESLLCITDHLLPQESQHWVSPAYLGRILEGQATNREPDRTEEIRWFETDRLPQNLTITASNAVRAFVSRERGRLPSNSLGTQREVCGRKALNKEGISLAEDIDEIQNS